MAYYPLKVKDGAGTIHTVGDPRINTADAIPQSSINGLDTALAGKVDTTDARLSDTRTPTDNSVTSAKIVDGSIVNADINASAAIALSKLATGALPTGITVASANIVNGSIVDADVSASAAIAQSKISGLTTALAAKADASSLAVMQVVSTTKVDVFSTTSTSLVDVTGLSATITPTSATNKILVLVTLAITPSTSGYSAWGGLFRDSTQIGGGTAASLRPSGSFMVRMVTASGGDGNGPHAASVLDSPASTSALTYKVKVAAESGSTCRVNASTLSDTDNVQFPRLASTITLMEISA